MIVRLAIPRLAVLRLKRIMAVTLLCVSIALPLSVSSQALDRSLATVRLHTTANVSRNEYRLRLALVEEQSSQKLTRSQQEQLLDAMIDAELILQDAKKLNIRVRDQDIDSSIEQQRAVLSQQTGQPISERQLRDLIEEQTGLDWTAYQQQVRNRLIQEMYVLRVKRELFSSVKEPADAEVKRFYEQNATQFTNPAIVHMEFLLLRIDNVSESEAKARETKARALHRTATASTDAFEGQKRASLDDPTVSATEVILLRENRQQARLYGPAFIREAFDLEEGFAPSVVESKLGYHVIRVLDTRSPKVLLLGDPILPGQSVTVSDQIRNRLLLERQQAVLQQAVQEAVSDLRARAEIKTFLDRL